MTQSTEAAALAAAAVADREAASQVRRSCTQPCPAISPSKLHLCSAIYPVTLAASRMTAPDC